MYEIKGLEDRNQKHKERVRINLELNIENCSAATNCSPEIFGFIGYQPTFHTQFVYFGW